MQNFCCTVTYMISFDEEKRLNWQATENKNVFHLYCLILNIAPRKKGNRDDHLMTSFQQVIILKF